MRTVFLFLFITTTIYSQRFEILSGNLKELKGISKYNVTFDYSNLKVNGKDTEEEFLVEKVDHKEKSGGRAVWYSDRENKYEPKFIDYFNKRFEKGEIVVQKHNDAAYTMNIKTTWIYSGYGIEPAKITAIITILETANPSHVLVAIEFEKSIGFELGQVVHDQGERIGGAYEKLAKNMAMQLKRFL